MNLTVSVVVLLRFLALQVRECHSNHSCLFLFYIEEFHEALLEEIFEIHLLSDQLLNVSLPDVQLIALDDKQRSLHPPGISEELDLLPANVSDDRDFLGYGVHSPHLYYVLDELGGLSVAPEPVAIHENLDQIRLLQGLGVQCREFLNTKVLQHISQDLSRGAYTHKRHQGEIFHQTTGLTFGGLGRANHAPVRVVELAGLRKLP